MKKFQLKKVVTMTLSDKTEEIFSLCLNYPLVFKKVTKMKVFTETLLKLLEAAFQFYLKRDTGSLSVPSMKYETSKHILFKVFLNITSFLDIFSFKKV